MLHHLCHRCCVDMCLPADPPRSWRRGYRKHTDDRGTNRLQHQTDPSSQSQTWLPSNLLMDVYVDLCCSFRLPMWIAPLLHAAKRLKSDRARRKKAYRLLQRKLMFHRVGVKEGDLGQPTYIYPEEVKMLMRSVFPENICDYPDPCHDRVVYLTVEDLHKVDFN